MAALAIMAGAAFFVRTLFMEDFIKKERRGCESKKTGRLSEAISLEDVILRQDEIEFEFRKIWR